MRMFDENENWTEESLRVSNEIYFELVRFVDEHPEFDKADLQVICHDAVNRAFLMLRAEKRGNFKVNRDMLKKAR